MFKIKNNLAPDILNNVFKLNGKFYNTGHNWDFKCRNTKKVLKVLDSICDLKPLEVRNLTSIS